MLKLCDKSICKSLSIILKSCLTQGIFPSEWKKANVVPIHKKNDKQCVNNYRPVILLPICSKVLERIIYNPMFTCFIENNLISENQSGFKSGDSCVNQLLTITHEIFSSFDDNYEARGVFLDISKAFDKVWHEGIIHKLKWNGISGNSSSLLTDFLRNRKRRVILNGQSSSWTNINAGVPQGSILGLLLFLIYINDLSDNLQCNPKLFADDTSLFSTVKVPERTANNLNNDLKEINKWAFQWKMSFNPDPTKQAQDVIFSRKTSKKIHPKIFFNNIPVSKVDSQKHLGLHLDSKLTFDIHIKTILTKVSRTIGLLRKFQQALPRPSLITIYKAFIRPQLDYGDAIFDQAFNNSFHQRLESIQYNAALAITGALRGTSKENLYQELGFESLQSRRWFRKSSFFYKMIKNKSQSYLYHLIPKQSTSYSTRNSKNLPAIKANHCFFKNTFFPSTVIEWNKLDSNIRCSPSYKLFRKQILEFIRPQPKSIFNAPNSLGLTYLTRLRVGLSHLHEHKFHTSKHYLLHCSNFKNERQTLLQNVRIGNPNLLSMNEDALIHLLLYGDNSLTVNRNTFLLNSVIEYIISTERFSDPLIL